MAITITERAAAHVRGMLSRETDAQGLRLGLTKSGCSGYAYIMDFARHVEETDCVFESNGVQLVVDSDSLHLLDGMELDYVREGLNEAFKFNNPNVKSACGCGESVGF